MAIDNAKKKEQTSVVTEVPETTEKKGTATNTTTQQQPAKTENIPLYAAAEQKVDKDAKTTTPVQPASATPITTPTSNSQVGTAMQKIDSALQPYSSKWQGLIDSTLNSLQNGKPFSYDLNGDILYHQYAEQFGRSADRAMRDTVGQVSALSGGYGNSYAQTAGQQAYSDTMSGLNDVIPQLYQLALNKYNQEKQDLKDMLSIYQDMENSDYGKYIDERDFAYTKGVDDRNFAYNEQQDIKNTAINMLNSGITPDDSILEKAGISPDVAQKWANSVVTGREEFDYGVQSDMRNEAISLLSSGIEVDKATLAKAGISEDFANKLLTAAKTAVVSSAGSYTGNQNSKLSTDDYIDVVDKIDEKFKTQGYDAASKWLFAHYDGLGLTYDDAVNILMGYEKPNDNKTIVDNILDVGKQVWSNLTNWVGG